MKAFLILLAAGSVAFGIDDFSDAFRARQIARERAAAAAESPAISSGTKIMSFRTPDGDRITVEVPVGTQPGTRFVFRMPDGERVTVYLY